ncbi:MAG: hypothetical protein WC716_04860 [Chitinophagaceae bacterium]
MKKAILLAVFLLVTFCGFGQMDYKFNYQAVVRNGSGALVSSGSTVGVRISILEGSASGTVLYQETHNAIVNNPQGLVNLVIGSGTPTVGAILFSGKFYDLTMDKYLKVEIDPSGGVSYTDLGATKLQFVPYAAHAFTATRADNGTQWADGSASSINYTAGKVNIGTSSPTGSSILNAEKSISTDHVVSVKQTGTTGGVYRGAIYGGNNATSGGGVGVIGEHITNGWGVYGTAGGTTGIGVYGDGPVGVKAESIASNGIAIELDGFMKVSGSKKTAFKTTPLVSAASNITLSYGGASSTDIVLVTPVSTSTTMPSWALIWTSPNWVLWNASDDAIPSNFPAGTSFNILVIKQ